MRNLDLPSTPTALTKALQVSGALQQGDAVGVDVTERQQTTISHLWFLDITYAEGASPALPRQLVLKWPLEMNTPPDATETSFYRDHATALPSPPVVRCLAAAEPPAPVQWVLLENVRATHTSYSWPEWPPDEQVDDAVAALAVLHARWWNAPTLGSGIGIAQTEASLRRMVSDISSSLPAFVDALGDDLPRADRQVLETVFSSALKPWLRIAENRSLTIIHGDAHPWNFLFPRAAPGVPYLLDWQTWHIDVGARDLAYMIALHLDAVARQRIERRLLETYHGSLIRSGVSDISLDELWLEYRRCVVRNLTFPIIYWRRGFPRERWRYRLDCALAAYRDLNAAELL